VPVRSRAGISAKAKTILQEHTKELMGFEIPVAVTIGKPLPFKVTDQENDWEESRMSRAMTV
jgi:hypothetical protein